MAYYWHAGRFEEAKRTYQEALARKEDRWTLHASRFAVAFLEGDTTEMDHQLSLVAGKPGEGALLSAQGDVEAFSGHLAKAREFSQRAIESAQHAEATEDAATNQMKASLREVEFGNGSLVHNEAASALTRSSTTSIHILAAPALARAGDSDRAQKMCDDLQKKTRSTP